MHRAHVLSLALLVAVPCASALADSTLRSLMLEAPAAVNTGPDRLGLVRLDFVVVNRSRQPVRLRAIDVTLRSRRVMDTELTEVGSRSARGLLIRPENREVSEPPPRSEIVVPPGRHAVAVVFDRLGTSAYHVQRASVRLRAIEGGVSREGTIELEVRSTRRHPRR